MDQLDETQKQVVTMQETLKLLQPQLITATQDVERMLLEVDKERQEVAEFEKVVKIDESVAEVTNIFTKITNEHFICTIRLATYLPTFDPSIVLIYLNAIVVIYLIYRFMRTKQLRLKRNVTLI